MATLNLPLYAKDGTTITLELKDEEITIKPPPGEYIVCRRTFNVLQDLSLSFPKSRITLVKTSNSWVY